MSASRRLLSRERIETALFRAGYYSIFLALVLPLVVVIGSSFSQAGTLTFPPREFSLRWYSRFIADPTWTRAFFNSIIIATGTMLVSLGLGVTAAYGVRVIRSDWVQFISPVVLMPLLLPPIVTGITLVIYLSFFDLYQTYISIVLAHSLWATPLVFFIMQAVFSRFDWATRDAALDLGSSPTRAFVEIILPQIREGIMAAGLVAFIISLQEFVMALFLSGYQTRTIPVLAWTALRQQLDPRVSVVSTLLILSIPLLSLPIVLTKGIEWLARQL